MLVKKVEGVFLGSSLWGLRTTTNKKKVAPSILKTIGTAGISSGVSEGFRKLFGNGIYLKLAGHPDVFREETQRP